MIKTKPLHLPIFFADNFPEMEKRLFFNKNNISPKLLIIILYVYNIVNAIKG